MHSDDFAWVIKKCIEEDIYENMNVATDEVLSIKQMADIAKIVCGVENISVEYNEKYPDGQYRKDGSNSKLMKLIGDFEFTSFNKGVNITYNWYMENH